MAEALRKASLDAHVDQRMMAVRDARTVLAALSGEGNTFLTVSDMLAGVLREQFPGTPDLGRIVLAVMVAMDSLRGAQEMAGYPLSVEELMTVTGLAAEHLDREEASRG